MPVAGAPVAAHFLTGLVTHLDEVRVREQLAYLERVAPGAQFVICYGGPRETYEALGLENSVFVADPSLRSRSTKGQTYNEVLQALLDGFVEPRPAVELIYLMEFDQVILRPGFEDELSRLSRLSDAGLFAKWASPRNDTNWPHFLAARDDARLNAFFERVSVRRDPATRLGCLGTGMLFRRAVLEAFCAASRDAPHAYLELFVPSLVHHLGYEVADIDAMSDLYDHVRWLPEFTFGEVQNLRRVGATFVHPFKQVDALRALADAPG